MEGDPPGPSSPKGSPPSALRTSPDQPHHHGNVALPRDHPHGKSHDSVNNAPGLPPGPEEDHLSKLSEQEMLAAAAQAENEDDWVSDDLDESEMDGETLQKRMEARKRKKEKIKQEMRLKREITVKKLDRDKDKDRGVASRAASRGDKGESDEEKEGVTREKEGGSKEREEPPERVVADFRRPTLVRQESQPLSPVEEVSGQNISMAVMKKTTSHERILAAAAAEKEEHERQQHKGILKSREPSAQPPSATASPTLKKRRGSHSGSEHSEHSDAPETRHQVIPNPGTRGEGFYPKPKLPPAGSSPDFADSTLARPGAGSRTLSRMSQASTANLGIARETLSRPNMDRAPSFMIASNNPPQKQKKSLVDHLFFGKLRAPMRGPNSPSILTPPPIVTTPGISDTARGFPFSPGVTSPGQSAPAPKLSVGSPSIASIPQEDIDAALMKATLPRTPVVDNDLL